MILQSTAVTNIIEDYRKMVPEVPLEFAETVNGVAIRVPRDFDSLPDITRLAAYTYMNKMCRELEALQVKFWMEIK